MRKLILFASMACCLMAGNATAAGMTDYCQTPPFIVGGIKPNLLLMLDNSASMYDLAYSAGTASFCYDNTYSNAQTYAGYFDTTKLYKYNLSPSANNTTPVASDKFSESSVALPDTCDYKTADLCINKSTASPYVITEFYATGNFLNWLSASKLDIQKQVLTGGKYDSTNTVLTGESRGCNGRRFIKEVTGLGVTFAVRGPNALEPDYVNPDTQGGLSRIEIYIGTNPNMADCQTAVTAWVSGNYGTAKTNTSSCLGTTNTEINAYNQIMQDCWTIKDNIKSGQPPFGKTGNNPSINSTKIQCLAVYRDICGSGSDGECSRQAGFTPSATTIPGAITSENSGQWQCTSMATHLSPPSTSPYYGGSGDTTGFVGSCITNYSWQGNALNVTWNDTCTQREILHYCYGSAAAEVVDPSEGAADTALTGNIPAILMDSSVRSLGTPAGTFYIRVQKTPAPTGLIQEFSNSIRFGTMGFNCIGSASESATVPGTCKTGTNLDGGKILHYIGYENNTVNESVGDHSAGLIKTVDDLKGETWTPLAEAYYNAIGYFARTSDYTSSPTSRTDLRINGIDDFDATKNPSQYRCQNNNILLISDGMSTVDQNSSVNSLATLYHDSDTYWGATNGTCPKFAGSQNLDDLAWLAKNRNIKTFSTSSASTADPTNQSESIMTHVVYTGTTSIQTAECNPDTLMQQTAINGGTESLRAENPVQLKQSLRTAFGTIAAQAASGTAVSVLSSSEGSGANLMQALFYPHRTFAGGTEVAWTSDLMNYWYYLDPFFTSSTIREDTKREGAASTPSYTLLNLQQDYVTSFAYDTDTNKTMAHRWQDATGKGTPLTDMGSVPIEETIPIWRAGFDLWWTLPTARHIYTSVDVEAATTATPTAVPNLIPFTVANRDPIDDFLGQTASTVDANATINFVRGYDCVNAVGDACVCGTAGCNKIGRNRTVTSGVCSTRKSPCSSAADCPTGETCDSATNVWKFGDVISSTPRIMGPGYLNNYNVKSPFGYNDVSYSDFIKSTDYQNRQLVFVGANDGMLHAFKLGKLLQKWTGQQWYETAKQEGDTGADGIGTESWAYIPKNVLPYLQYTHDEDYCHIYMVDGPTTISDVTINKPSTSSCTEAEYWNCPKQTTVDATTKLVDFTKTSWTTILVGSAGIGGATCDTASPDVDPDWNISTPQTVAGNSVGWSSYYALDVTEQAMPKLLWEFSNPDLGVTNVGPAIIKVGGKEKRCAINNDVCTTDADCDPVATKGICTTTNGRWLAVLASGSTGPISNLEFKGKSDKSLKIFVLDLKTGALLRTIDTGAVPTNLGITNAFAGSISSSALDLEKDRPSDSGNYQDDALYIGYVKDITAGGVLRLVINDDSNPDNWTVSKVIDGTGPITTSVVNLLDRKNKKLWLYFGEGRYFYKLDDPTNQRRLYGIEEPCFDADANTILPTCTSSLTTAVLKDQTTTISTTLTPEEKGWFVDMNPAAGATGAERVISNPTPDPLGAIFFLSFAPTSDVCSFGGTSYLWAMDYKTGGTVTYDLQGKALIQVSTGEIKELSLKDALTENGNRKSEGFKGIPPTGQGLMILSSPVPIKKFMHVQEQ